MFIKYKESKEFPKAEIIKEMFELSIIKPAGEADRSVTDIVLIAGDEYKVKHNGSEYNCVAWEEDGVIHIGGESEPFDIYNFAGDIYVKAETAGANTFEVHHEKVKTFDYDVMPKGYPGTKTEEGQEVVTPMDYKFMPEGYPKVEMKMVEIVPEQSVTGEFNEEDGINTIELVTKLSINQLNVVKSIVVTFNGKKYECDFIEGEFGDMYAGAPWGDFSEYPFTMYAFGNAEDPKGYLNIYWPPEIGETITLAIYEEKETITPLDPKFVGGVVIETTDGGGSWTCTHTFDELVNMYWNAPAQLAKTIIFYDLYRYGRAYVGRPYRINVNEFAVEEGVKYIALECEESRCNVRITPDGIYSNSEPA